MNKDRLVAWLRAHLAGRNEPLFVGLDGPSGAGKSTIAAVLSHDLDLDVSVIQGDEFYGGGSLESWAGRSAPEIVANGIDWARQRRVLESLRSDGQVRWAAFDWETDDWDSDEARLSGKSIETFAHPLVLLEGAYSCRPELHSVLDRLVLLDPPRNIRRAQLLAREGEAYRSKWEALFSEAEDHYFNEIMPSNQFDLVLDQPA